MGEHYKRNWERGGVKDRGIKGANEQTKEKRKKQKKWQDRKKEEKKKPTQVNTFVSKNWKKSEEWVGQYNCSSLAGTKHWSTQPPSTHTHTRIQSQLNPLASRKWKETKERLGQYNCSRLVGAKHWSDPRLPEHTHTHTHTHARAHYIKRTPWPAESERRRRKGLDSTTAVLRLVGAKHWRDFPPRLYLSPANTEPDFSACIIICGWGLAS